MSANKYLQKILEIYGLDIKTIGGRSENNNREHDSIKGGIFGFNRKSKVAPADISNNVSCIDDTEYMGKIQKSLSEMKKKMKTKGLKEVIIPNNAVIFVGITKPLRINMANNYVDNLGKLFSEFMKNDNIADETKTVKEIVTFLNGYFKNCNHVSYYIDNLIDATLKRLIMTKPNIKQLTNGINPSYGGGFILFDSEFKPQNIIHTNYSNATDIVMHNMLISDYTDASVNAFMSGIQEKTNETELNVSELVSIMKSIINV